MTTWDQARAAIRGETLQQLSRRRIVLANPCPWCRAKPNEECRTSTGLPITQRTAHPSREELA